MSLHDGIHTASCSGTYQVAVQALGGLGFTEGRLTIDPALPAEWTSLTYPVRWRRQRLVVSVDSGDIEVAAAPDNAVAVELVVQGEAASVAPGGTMRSVPVSSPSRRA